MGLERAGLGVLHSAYFVFRSCWYIAGAGRWKGQRREKLELFPVGRGKIIRVGLIKGFICIVPQCTLEVFRFI